MKVFRTIIESVTDGAVRTFTGTGESGGQIEGEIIQQVGIKSHPRAGDSGLVIQDGDRVYLIATDNDIAPATVAGERVIAFDSNNFVKFVAPGGVLQKIHVKTDKAVDVEAVENVNVSGAQVQVISTVVKMGIIAAVVAFVTAPFLAWVAAHTHKESGGGETLPPTQTIGPGFATIHTFGS